MHRQPPTTNVLLSASQYNREGDGAAFHYHIGLCNSSVAGGSSPSWTFLFTVRSAVLSTLTVTVMAPRSFGIALWRFDFCDLNKFLSFLVIQRYDVTGFQWIAGKPKRRLIALIYPNRYSLDLRQKQDAPPFPCTPSFPPESSCCAPQ